MRLYIEFVGIVAEKIGRKYLWLILDDVDTISVYELFMHKLSSIIGKETIDMIFNAYKNNEVLIVVNGVLVPDLNINIKDGDKLYIFPMAFGGYTSVEKTNISLYTLLDTKTECEELWI